MASNKLLTAHILNVAGWACVIGFFTIVQPVGKPAFLLLAPAILLCGLALKFYNAAALEKVASSPREMSHG
jgi:hypothetical protein